MKPYIKVWNSDHLEWEFWTDQRVMRGLVFVGMRDSVVYLAFESSLDQACAYFEQGVIL